MHPEIRATPQPFSFPKKAFAEFDLDGDRTLDLVETCRRTDAVMLLAGTPVRASKGGNPPGGGLSTNLSLQRLSTNPSDPAGFLYNSRGEIHPSSYTGRDVVPDGV